MFDKKGDYMNEEQLVYNMICYIKEHGIKALMVLVMKAIEKSERRN